MTHKPRPYQTRALDKIEAKYAARVNRLLVRWATGTGKTVLFSNLPDRVKLTGRMLVLVHREELATQAAQKMIHWNPYRRVGIEMASNRARHHQIVVASVPTLGRPGSQRLKDLKRKDFQLFVTDECHHAPATTYQRIYEHFDIENRPDALHVGVTATTRRSDGVGLGTTYQELVDDFGLVDAVKQGYLAPPIGYRIYTDTSLDGVKKVAGELNQNQLSSTVNTPQRNRLIVETWLELARDRRTIAFSVDIDHAQDLAQTYRDFGVQAEAIWGNDPDRADKLEAHKAGVVQVLVNCNVLTEGYDDWQVSCIVNAAPTLSELRYTQRVGRGTRIQGDIDNLITAYALGHRIVKADCLVLDFVDSTKQHSLVTAASLAGLSSEMDLRGRSLIDVVEEIEGMKVARPDIDFSKAKDAGALKGFVEEVDLLKAKTWPASISEISTNGWRNTSANNYVLLLTDGEHIVVMPDFRTNNDSWVAYGTVKGVTIHETRATLHEAIEEADYKVRIHGGRTLQSLIRRDSSWQNEPPSPAQVFICNQFRIAIPEGMTRGVLQLKINEVINGSRSTSPPLL